MADMDIPPDDGESEAETSAEAEQPGPEPKEHKTGQGNVVVPVLEVRYTQSSIGNAFTDGRRFEDLIDGLLDGRINARRARFLKLEAVQIGNSYRSMNNRRLHCLHEFQKQTKQEVKIRLKVIGSFDNVAALKRVLRQNTTNNDKEIIVRAPGPPLSDRVDRCSDDEQERAGSGRIRDRDRDRDRDHDRERSRRGQPRARRSPSPAPPPWRRQGRGAAGGGGDRLSKPREGYQFVMARVDEIVNPQVGAEASEEQLAELLSGEATVERYSLEGYWLEGRLHTVDGAALAVLQAFQARSQTEVKVLCEVRELDPELAEHVKALQLRMAPAA